MKCYKPEKVNKDLPGIILLSHGPFAVSLVDTAKMLFGESENIAAYSLEPGDDIDKYREAFVETINEFPEGSMILVDLKTKIYSIFLRRIFPDPVYKD